MVRKSRWLKCFGAAFSFLALASVAHAQSGLVPANTVQAGPTSGGQNFPKYRLLVPADIPTLSLSTFALASGQIVVGQVSGFAGAVAMSGDCTIVASGAIVCTKTNGLALTTLSTTVPGTGVAAALAVNTGSAGAFVVNGGALGTPASGVATNLTGTAAGLTAGNVTTNANLTGAVTSTGNATSLGSFSSANLRGALTDESGTGAAYFQGGAIGTPSAGVGTTLTALNASNLTTGTVAPARGGVDTTAWSTFSPALSCGTGTLTNNSARSKTIGKTTFVELDFTISVLGTCNNAVTVTLPNTAQSAAALVGRETVSIGSGMVCSIAASATTSFCTKTDATALAAGLRYLVSGVYENQ